MAIVPFNVGDFVTAGKFKGPVRMYVEDVEDDKVTCVWFTDAKEFKRATLPSALLEAVLDKKGQPLKLASMTRAAPRPT